MNAHAAQGRLAGKMAVITGGSSGIGLETARRYLEEGARVLITGRDQQRLDKAVDELGEGAFGCRADSSVIADLDSLAGEAKSKLGRVDILFANAGLGIFLPIEDVDEAAYDKQFDINVKGVFFTVQKLLPLMSNGGSIILTASAVHEKGVPTGSLYFATKSAVRSFARTLAAELGPRGIRVNALSPGIARTEFVKRVNVAESVWEDYTQMIVSQAPLGRAGTPLDMANAAVFLGSDEASYITAEDLLVDGGWMNV
ncbi:MAG: glucose 1-dehydrogenase [Alphaproteobacteria bacterium]|nr:glucose 1-dehydrogenase [Alphaproteobacteria bacterium]